MRLSCLAFLKNAKIADTKHFEHCIELVAQKRNKKSRVLKEVRDVKYRQRVFKDKKKELKKNPPDDYSMNE